MSFSHSFVAARCDLSRLQAAFLVAWPHFELVAPAQSFPTWEQAYAWATPRSEFLRGRHPEDVKLLFQDGDWSLIQDFSQFMATDDLSLVTLSRQIGRVVAASTQGTAGFAELVVVDDGQLARRISREDGQVSASGKPLAEEAGFDLDKFYLEEIDAIWQRLGMTSFLQQQPAGPVLGLHLKDLAGEGDS